MRKMPWALCLWPGLPQLARHGSWPALAVAVAAASLLNVVLLATFVWTDLVSPQVRIMYWLSLGVAWSGAAAISLWWDRGPQDRKGRAGGGEPFAKALDLYLQGNWLEAERILDRLLRDDPRDLEARLMLATLLRHTRRFEEATEHLNTLVRLEGARKWEMEISREGELLSEARQERVEAPPSEAIAPNGVELVHD